jgi:hypothetical protein
MINWKGCEEKESWPNLSYFSAILKEELRKSTINPRITGDPAEMQAIYWEATVASHVSRQTNITKIVSRDQNRRPPVVPVLN